MNESAFKYKALKIDVNFAHQVSHDITAIRIDFTKLFSNQSDFRGFFYDWITCIDICYNPTSDIEELACWQNQKSFVKELGRAFESVENCGKIFIDFKRNTEDDKDVYAVIFQKVRDGLLQWITNTLRPESGNFEELEGYHHSKEYISKRYHLNRPGYPFPMSECYSEDSLDLIEINTGIDFRKLEIEKWL